MLTGTFLHAHGIGDITERKIWESGILTWDDLLRASPNDVPVSLLLWDSLRQTVEESVTALKTNDFRYFAAKLPQREHWRAAPHVMETIGFLDIETNGGMSGNSITIIGVYDGFDSRIYVKSQDLQEFESDAKRFACWVTFFGTGFDIPMLRRRFPEMPFDQLHIDLCPALRRLGFKGGLKRIEKQLGIARVDEVDGLSGSDAISLWRRWNRFGEQEALDLLVAYNRADIENLALLLAFTYGRLKIASGYPAQKESDKT